MLMFRTVAGSAALAGSVLFAASADADMHLFDFYADTSYGEFLEMDINRRAAVIAEEMEALFYQVYHTDRMRALCINDLFEATGEGRLAPGFRAVIDVIEFDGNRPMRYEHDRTVEQLVAQIIELHCPTPS